MAWGLGVRYGGWPWTIQLINTEYCQLRTEPRLTGARACQSRSVAGTGVAPHPSGAFGAEEQVGKNSFPQTIPPFCPSVWATSRNFLEGLQIQEGWRVGLVVVKMAGPPFTFNSNNRAFIAIKAINYACNFTCQGIAMQ